jgi:caa(3)-type oxidase subunit IV
MSLPSRKREYRGVIAMATVPDNPDAHNGPLVKAYLVVFGALAILTHVSFVANYAAHPEQQWLTSTQSFVIILGVAIIKAVLVAMFFMHLKFDWGRVYFMIVPVLILGTMMVIVLLPDIVLGWPLKGEKPPPPAAGNVKPAP